MEKAYLVLSTGQVFEGYSLGAKKEQSGGFTVVSGPIGYTESLTAKANAGKFVVFSFPLAGNYGVIPGDIQGGCTACGFIAREVCDAPSNFRCGGTLSDYLSREGVPAICGIDTRELIGLLRDDSSITGTILYRPQEA